MNFNKIIANPPYSGNLHLKILREAMKHIEKDGGEIISLQPCDTFLNINVTNKLSTEIAKKIDTLEIISEKEANKLFGIYISSKLGIFHIFEGAKGLKMQNEEFKTIIEKLRNHVSIRSSIAIRGKDALKDENKIYLPIQGDYGYAKGWHYKLEDIINCNANSCLAFDTEDEVKNFKEYVTKSWPCKLMYKIDDNAAVIAHLPFLPTYKKPWTDADLYEYFNLTPEEIKEIENAIR